LKNIDSQFPFQSKKKGESTEELQSQVEVLSSSLAQNAKKIKTPLDFGAKGDGVADDTIAVQAAIDAMQYSKLYMQNGTFKITGQLLIKYPITIVGNKIDGQILVASNVNNTTDILVIDPSVSDSEDYIIQNLYIIPQSGTPGRDYFVVKTSSTKFVRQIKVDGCYFASRGGGYGIRLTNPTANLNPNGISFLNVQDCIIYGGIRGENLGDSCFFERNNIKGNNIGINIDQVNDVLGASAGIVVRGNNIKNNGGVAKFNNFAMVVFEDNNTEQEAILDNGYAVIFQNSISVTGFRSSFKNNKVSCFDPSSKANTVKIENVKQLDIYGSSLYVSSESAIGGANRTALTLIACEDINLDNMSITLPLDTTGLSISSTCKNISIGKMNYTKQVAVRAIECVDSGEGTSGIEKSITTTWLVADGAIKSLHCTKYTNGLVSVWGRVKPPDSHLTGGTIIGTLPLGFRPSELIMYQVPIRDLGGVRAMMDISITNNGEIVVNTETFNVMDVNFSGQNFLAGTV
jgi:hypothetical protein